MKEFRINEYLTLKLENNNTVIYVNGEEFMICKFLLLNISVKKISTFDDIASIDEAAERLDKSLEPHMNFTRKIHHSNQIPPETEFWGHCSNLQVWYENDYDTRLLHRNMAFPLLKKLTDVGDPLAKKVFKEEIIFRYLEGIETVKEYLYFENYFSYLDTEEIINGILKPEDANTLIELISISNNNYKFAENFSEDKVRKERFFLENLYFSEKNGYVDQLEVDLNHLNYSLPEILSQFRKLSRLVVFGNSKRDVILKFRSPIFVENLELNVNGNIIIPDNFENFKNLHILSIYGSKDTKFERIPNSIGLLSKLTLLDIRYIPLEQSFLYALTKLKNPKALYLLECRCTKIKEIPNLTSEMPSLQTIKIEDMDDDILKLLDSSDPIDYEKKK